MSRSTGYAASAHLWGHKAWEALGWATLRPSLGWTSLMASLLWASLRWERELILLALRWVSVHSLSSMLGRRLVKERVEFLILPHLREWHGESSLLLEWILVFHMVDGIRHWKSAITVLHKFKIPSLIILALLLSSETKIVLRHLAWETLSRESLAGETLSGESLAGERESLLLESLELVSKPLILLSKLVSLRHLAERIASANRFEHSIASKVVELRKLPEWLVKSASERPVLALGASNRPSKTGSEGLASLSAEWILLELH